MRCLLIVLLAIACGVGCYGRSPELNRIYSKLAKYDAATAPDDHEGVTFLSPGDDKVLGAAHLLKAHPNLKSLSFHGTGVTDAVIPVVLECKELEELNLRDTEISSDGIRRLLSGLPRLRLVEAEPQDISQEDLLHLRQEFPAVSFSVW